MKYFCVTVWQIFMFRGHITHTSVCWFSMGNAPKHQFKELGRKMRESKVLEEIVDKLFMGGMTLAGLDPTNGRFIPKVNSWSAGGC